MVRVALGDAAREATEKRPLEIGCDRNPGRMQLGRSGFEKPLDSYTLGHGDHVAIGEGRGPEDSG